MLKKSMTIQIKRQKVKIKDKNYLMVMIKNHTIQPKNSNNLIMKEEVKYSLIN